MIYSSVIAILAGYFLSHNHRLLACRTELGFSVIAMFICIYYITLAWDLAIVLSTHTAPKFNLFVELLIRFFSRGLFCRRPFGRSGFRLFYRRLLFRGLFGGRLCLGLGFCDGLVRLFRLGFGRGLRLFDRRFGFRKFLLYLGLSRLCFFIFVWAVKKYCAHGRHVYSERVLFAVTFYLVRLVLGARLIRARRARS